MKEMSVFEPSYKRHSRKLRCNWIYNIYFNGSHENMLWRQEIDSGDSKYGLVSNCCENSCFIKAVTAWRTSKVASKYLITHSLVCSWIGYV